MGSCTAYHLLKSDPALKVLVIEKDLSYERASTTLSMANARIQFSLKHNVQISQYALEVLADFEEEMQVEGQRPAISYCREGNLFLYDAESLEAAQKAYEMQKSLGCAIKWWQPSSVTQHYPVYENLEGIAGASFGPQDGHFDGYAVLMGFKSKARSLGARYVQDEVVELISRDGAIQGVRTAGQEVYSSEKVVNCTGAWVNQILKSAGIVLPVEPVKRQVVAVKYQIPLDYPLPLTILPSGFYFRTETGGLLLLGKSLPQDPVGFDFNWDQERFMLLWQELYEFAPAFEALKLVRGWAGLYAVNLLDANAIVGEWPELKGLYLANGFSGHGLQQGPAVGRYLSELITGREPSLDLSIFSPQRVLDNQPILEDGIV